MQMTIITGYLGRDAEMRFTPSGVPVANFPVACTEKWNAADGTRQEETTWYRCTAWGKRAETAAQWLKKGGLVTVVGKNTMPSAWVDRDGSARASIELRVERYYMLGKKDAGNQSDDAWPGHEGGQAETGEDVPF